MTITSLLACIFLLPVCSVIDATIRESNATSDSSTDAQSGSHLTIQSRADGDLEAQPPLPVSPTEELKQVLQTIYESLCLKKMRCPAKELEDVLSLISRRADINTTNRNGYTALHLAALSNNVPFVHLLVKKSANVNSVDHSNAATPLHLATTSQFTMVTKILSNNGAHFTVPNRFGNSPLHIAAANGSLETMKIFIAHSADINATDGLKRTAMQTILSNLLHFNRVPDLKYAYLEMMKLLADNGATFANEFLQEINKDASVVNWFKEAASSIQWKGYNFVNSPQFLRKVRESKHFGLIETVKEFNRQYRQILKKEMKNSRMLITGKLKITDISNL